MSGPSEEAKSPTEPRRRTREQRARTPAGGIAALNGRLSTVDDDIEDMEERVARLERWKAALAGEEGVPGYLAGLEKSVGSVRDGAAKDLAALQDKHDKHGVRLQQVEHIFFKIIAVAGACSLVGGVLASIVFKFLLGK
jgi:hypothetical protein